MERGGGARDGLAGMGSGDGRPSALVLGWSIRGYSLCISVVEGVFTDYSPMGGVSYFG